MLSDLALRNLNLPDVFLGFRARESYDADLTDAFASHTSIYSWNGSTYNDFFETYWLGSVATGQAFYEPLSGITTRQLSISADGGSAVVSICRNTTMAETGALCYNGLDDDCDGLIDGNDPNCGGTVPGAPTPANVPPPPPTAGAVHCGLFLPTADPSASVTYYFLIRNT